MADPTKQLNIHGGTLLTDIKNTFTRRTVAFAYFSMFAFVAFTVFLAFSPSQNSNSTWLINMFSDGTKSYSFNNVTSSGSQFSSIVSHFFPNSSQKSDFGSQHVMSFNSSVNGTEKGNALEGKDIDVSVNNTGNLIAQNGSQDNNFPVKVDSNITVESPRSAQKGAQENGFSSVVNNNSSIVKNETLSGVVNLDGNQNASFSRESGFPGRVDNATNQTVSVSKGKTGKANSDVASRKHDMDDWIKSLMDCDLYDGEWVMDESYPLYKPGSCSFIDEQFNCIRNGRPDSDYQKYKWKPKGCTLPRMNGSHLLELIRGKRLVFVGDSLNRNMWESLVCFLRNSVKDRKKVYEAHGKVNFRGEAMYSFVFKDYKCTVEFFVAPFLVREWEMPDKNGTKRETLRLDLVGRSSFMYKDADFIVFNTGHWWTHEKTSKGLDYYQEGNHVYGELKVLEAFRKALTTWGRWVDAYVNPEKSIVFFRGYSVSHFSGGQWNSGGACDNETEPIKNDKYIKPYPSKMMVLESVLKKMKTHVTYINITRLTDYRKDGHPSIYRRLKVPDHEKREPMKDQDCSHWCLPGVPDAWNELLYAELLVRLYQKQHSRGP